MQVSPSGGPRPSAAPPAAPDANSSGADGESFASLLGLPGEASTSPAKGAPSPSERLRAKAEPAHCVRPAAQHNPPGNTQAANDAAATDHDLSAHDEDVADEAGLQDWLATLMQLPVARAAPEAAQQPTATPEPAPTAAAAGGLALAIDPILAPAVRGAEAQHAARAGGISAVETDAVAPPDDQVGANNAMAPESAHPGATAKHTNAAAPRSGAASGQIDEPAREGTTPPPAQRAELAADAAAGLARGLGEHRLPETCPAAPDPALPTALTPTARSDTHVAAQQAPAVSLPVPLEDPRFAQALGLQVSLLARDGVHEASLRLNPADMGPVSVQIVLDGTQARVEFGADMARTRELIERSLPELAAALRDAGLTLSGGGVSQQQAGRGERQAQAGAVARRDRTGRAELTAGEATVAPARRWVRSGGVDLYA
jgi:flagellar hook-length control protein FliK